MDGRPVSKKRRASINDDGKQTSEVVNQPSGSQVWPTSVPSGSGEWNTSAGNTGMDLSLSVPSKSHEQHETLAIRRPHAGLPTVPSNVEISGRSFEEDYALGEELGRGTFSVVRKCFSKHTGETRAVKIIDTRRFRLSQTFRATSVLDEVRILRSLDHPGIIRVYEVYDRSVLAASAVTGSALPAPGSAPTDCIMVVTELAPGGELFDSIIKAGNFTEYQARHVLWQVLDALRYLHDRGVVHRDLKPENLLVAGTMYMPVRDPVLRPGRAYPNSFLEAEAVTRADPANVQLAPMLTVKLADFGVARYVGNAAYSAGATTFVGSPQYVAPEVLFARESYSGTTGSGSSVSYGRAVDVYSLGVIAYVMLAGYLPFDDGAPLPSDPSSQERCARVLTAKRALAISSGVDAAQVAALGLTWEDRVKHGLFFMTPPVWTHISESGKDLIRGMMAADPSVRLTVHACMAHAWFETTRAGLEGRGAPGQGPQGGAVGTAGIPRMHLPIADMSMRPAFSPEAYAQRLFAVAGGGGGPVAAAPLPLALTIHGASNIPGFQGPQQQQQQLQGSWFGAIGLTSGGSSDVNMGLSMGMGVGGTRSSHSTGSPAEFHIDATAASQLWPSHLTGPMNVNGSASGLGLSSHSVSGYGEGGFSAHAHTGMGVGNAHTSIGSDSKGDFSTSNARQVDVLRAVSSSINFTALLAMQREVAATFYASYESVRAIPQAALIVRAHAVQARDLQRQVRKVVLSCRSLSLSILEIMPDLQESVLEGSFGTTHNIFERMGMWVKDLKREASSMQGIYGELIAAVQSSLEHARMLNLEGHAHAHGHAHPHGSASAPPGVMSAGTATGSADGPGLRLSEAGSPTPPHTHGVAQWLPTVRPDALVLFGQKHGAGMGVGQGYGPGPGAGGVLRAVEDAELIRRLHAERQSTASTGATGTPATDSPTGSCGGLVDSSSAGVALGPPGPSYAPGGPPAGFSSAFGLPPGRDDDLLELFLSTPNVVADEAKFKRMLTSMGMEQHGAGTARGSSQGHAEGQDVMPDAAGRRDMDMDRDREMLPSMLAGMSVCPSDGSGRPRAFGVTLSVSGAAFSPVTPDRLSTATPQQSAPGTPDVPLPLDARPTACLGCALEGLRAVDQVLSSSVDFWASMELVIDMLVRRKEHSQALLETSASARMVSKALASLADYAFFWRAFAILSEKYAEVMAGPEGAAMYAWLVVPGPDEEFGWAKQLPSSAVPQTQQEA